MIVRLGMMLCWIALASLPLLADEYSVEYAPSTKPDELQFGVTYTVWIPEGVSQLRGVIVHQHGCGTGACKGGETAAYDLHWQALARKWDCALLGPSYHQPEGANCRLWCDPRNGSERAFLTGLHDLAEKSGHPELETVPWCLWGHSGGAYWASLMQVRHPERIVAIWLRSGTAFGYWERGEIERPDIPEAAYRIPTMINPGAKERDHERFHVAWDGGLAMFKAYRKQGAPIGFAPDPRTAHECGDSRYLAIPYFSACLQSRLPQSRGVPLRAISDEHAWLAPVLGTQAVAATDYKGQALEAVWLPNAEIANAWSEYVQNGATSDTTPPPAPTQVALMQEGAGVRVSWTAEADFESGLRAFEILKDGKVIGQVPEKPIGKFGRPLLQSMSYHDTPEPGFPALVFTDPAGEAARHEYGVRAINSVGLRSDVTTAVR